MSRPSLSTPCPAPPTLYNHNHNHNHDQDSYLSFADETQTSEVDYTRATASTFQHQARPPRRKSTFQRQREKRAEVTILEDDGGEGSAMEVGMGLGRERKGMLLSKPAQKRVGALVLGEMGQAHRRPRMSMVAEDTGREESTGGVAKETKAGLRKDPRRRTIFVPGDDTTMLTIHPGARDGTERLEDTFHIPAAAPVPQRREEREKEVVRKPRMSLAAAPKRVPLQHLVAKENNLLSTDIAGQGGGKENLPPKSAKLDVVMEKPGKAVDGIVAGGRVSSASSRLLAPTAASQARQTIMARKAVPVSKVSPKPAVAKPHKSTLRSSPMQNSPGLSGMRLPDEIEQPRRSIVSRRPNRPYLSPDSTSGRESGAPQRPTPPKSTLPSNRTFARNTGPSRVSQYAILTEDVAQPQLYEDNWLSHQEIALAELVNSIFASATNSKPEAWQTPQLSLRDRMLDIYHQPTVANLHQRLQACLSYGALSWSKSSANIPDPAHDLGLRRRFLNLWLNTYDEHALRAAAEVVIGRQVPRKACSSLSSVEASESVLDPSKGRRALIGFLETFMVTVEDVDSSDVRQSGTIGDMRWRKMILRSLMLVWLLDQSKAAGLVEGCLFRTSSSIKSSAAVLRALSSMLIPSIGDITRTLRHFDFEVGHAQDPLHEVVYEIQNIAVDLRDGIFLIRLVEILLFRSGRDEADVAADQDATVTIALPDFTILESALYADNGSPAPRILSQHLKMPCLGRAQKTHNVQVALSALSEHGNLVGTTLDDITADDIVDGHREKTLSLLWSLVSHHGLAQLVDWDELSADIRRAGGRLPEFEHFAHSPRESLLEAWAAAHAMRKRVQVRNLTTSFADGRAYAAILDDFTGFVHTATAPSRRLSDSNGSGIECTTTLEAKLRALGCSTAFTRQLVNANTAIPSRTTTISNLAFLASRLLPLARRHNAAEVIQRAFLRRLARRKIMQRLASARVAHACASVVQAQNKIIGAATVVQRAWRAVLEARIARLNHDVVGFQVLAKGWMTRQHTRKAALTSVRGASHSLRIMGGW